MIKTEKVVTYSYDEELGMYYLQSRYYDAEVGRFINADDANLLVSNQGNLMEVNLFAYCGNDPVNNQDTIGKLVLPLKLKIAVVAGIAGGIYKFVKFLSNNWNKKKNLSFWKSAIKQFFRGFVQGALVLLLSGNRKWVYGIIGGIVKLVYNIIFCGVRKPAKLLKIFIDGYTAGVVSKSVSNVLKKLPLKMRRKEEISYGISVFCGCISSRYIKW